MIEAVIIDDEPKNTRILRRLLGEFCKEVTVVAEGTNMQQGLQLIREYHPSLVFLDIEMPYGNAFDLLDQLIPVDFEIIFVTAFNEYALRAFKYCALDYLLKPVNIEELKTAVKRAIERKDLKSINQQLGYLFQNLKNNSEPHRKIAFQTTDGLVFVAMEEIIRCESNMGYSYIYTKTQGKIISSKTIKEYEELLPENLFFRVHHSHIVNLTEISKYQRGRGGFIQMRDGTKIEVAARRKDDFLSRFNIS